MPSKKEEIVKLLLNIQFDGSKNEFEEFYGDCVSYQEIEQESYQDLKMMVEGEIGKAKFRKARDISGDDFLTCRVEMTTSQYEKFISIHEGKEIDIKKTNDYIENPEGRVIYKKFKFLHDFIIDSVRLQNKEMEEEERERIKNKKSAYQKYKDGQDDFEIVSLDVLNDDDDDTKEDYNDE